MVLRRSLESSRRPASGCPEQRGLVDYYVSTIIGLVAALCGLFLAYGAWLCILYAGDEEPEVEAARGADAREPEARRPEIQA
jgi:hypothetical protein